MLTRGKRIIGVSIPLAIGAVFGAAWAGAAAPGPAPIILPSPTGLTVKRSCGVANMAEMETCVGASCQTMSSSCFPFRCDTATKTCSHSCSSDSDCASRGVKCFAGNCQVLEWRCDGDHTISDGARIIDCKAYRCTSQGPAMCLTRCQANIDCNSTKGAYECNARGECVKTGN